MPAVRIVALAVATVFASLGFLHFYWAAKGMDPRSAALPQRDGKPLFVPGRGVTIVVGVLLGVASMLLLARGGWLVLPMPRYLVAIGTWGVALTMLGRAVGDFRRVGFFKPGQASRFGTMDTWVYSPVALVLGLGTVWVAWR